MSVAHNARRGTGAPLGDVLEWARNKRLELERRVQEATRVRQAAWDKAIQSGEALGARTPQHFLALQNRAQAGNAPQSPAAGDRRAQRFNALAPRGGLSILSYGSLTPVGIQRLAAFAGGAEDALTLGMLDRYNALQTAIQGGGLGGVGSRYGQIRELQKAQNEFDSKRHPVSRGSGQVAGTAVGLVGPGIVSGPGRAVKAVEGAAALTGRELAAIGGAGAGLGLAGQAASDISRGELSPAQDYFGAAAGGAAGTVVGTRANPAWGGATDGAVTVAVQDVLNGRGFSPERVQNGAYAGSVTGGLGGSVGVKTSSSLPIWRKGYLGDGIAELRTNIRGDPPLPLERDRWGGFKKKRNEEVFEGTGVTTYPDLRTQGGALHEAKFGPRSDTSVGQELTRMWDTRNLVFHSGPEDIGKATGAVAANFTEKVSREPLKKPPAHRARTPAPPRKTQPPMAEDIDPWLHWGRW
jgi:hypothetical protein